MAIMVIVAVGGIAFATSTMLVNKSKDMAIEEAESKTMTVCFSSGRVVFADVVHSYDEEKSGWTGKMADPSGSLLPVTFRGSGDWACLTTDVTYAASK